MDARPATSCHCWFKADCSMTDLETGFVLQNSCIARERHPCTYFSLIGYQGSKSEVTKEDTEDTLIGYQGGYGGNYNR